MSISLHPIMRRLMFASAALALVGVGAILGPSPLQARAVARHASARERAPERAPTRVTIIATDYAYQMPDTIDAGAVEFVLRNNGTELHHAQFVRIDGNHTVQELLAALGQHGPPPAWAVLAGGPNTPNPGAESRGIVSLKAGRHAIICVIPSPDGKPHVAKGMVREFIVRPAASPAAMPTADVTLTLNDYNFLWSRPVTAGKTMLAVTTAPRTQPHEVIIAKLMPGKQLKDALAWIEAPNGPPPVSMIGGTAGVLAGDRMLVPLDLAAGNYVLLCMMPDAKDGKPHIVYGMSQQFAVR